MPNKVKCKDCGFLSLRHRVGRYLGETEKGIRDGGDFPVEIDHQGVYQLVFLQDPICFAMAWNLKDEKCAGENDVAEFHRIVHSERDCGSFEDWKQGYSPKELQDMIDRKWMREQDVKHNIRTLLVGLVGIIVGAVVTIGATWSSKPPVVNVYTPGAPMAESAEDDGR